MVVNSSQRKSFLWQDRKYIVAAYTSAPSLFGGDLADEVLFYERLEMELPLMAGLEIPFWGNGLHKYGSDFLLPLIPSSTHHVVTCVPGSVFSCKENKRFGLASDDPVGRKAAIKMHATANDLVKKINDYNGRQCVTAVCVATAPSIPMKGVSSSIEALKSSLKQLLSWDWDGARVVIEHCDAACENGDFAKGFMSLADEIFAVTQIGRKKNLGISINWGRSVIEGRSIQTPLKHLKQLIDVRCQSGLMFSGTAKKDSLYGCWQDNHMPFSTSKISGKLARNSLLTEGNVKDCLSAVNDEEFDYIGVKLMPAPNKQYDIHESIDINKDALNILERAAKGLG